MLGALALGLAACDGNDGRVDNEVNYSAPGGGAYEGDGITAEGEVVTGTGNATSITTTTTTTSSPAGTTVQSDSTAGPVNSQ